MATTVDHVRAARADLAPPVGLIPTMGFLHEGHMSLIRAARPDCASVAVSLFVNPSQFGPHEDFARYPRSLERDTALMEGAGVDLVFAPTVEAMYPPGFSTSVDAGALAERFEGAARPGHFRGVATVVTKLLAILQPHRAYFGQKDAQQLHLIRHVVADLNIPVQIVASPTVREADGLALSSRNVYLSAEERRAARVLITSMRAAETLFRRGERRVPQLRQTVLDVLAQEPLARPDYVAVVDPTSFDECSVVQATGLICLAVWVGSTRLIDNLLLSTDHHS